jgi:phosphoketolase
MTATETGPLTTAELDLINSWWRAASCLSVGQIYLLDNPLLSQPLQPGHVKRRLLGYWGTTAARLNRVTKNSDLNAIYIAGPGATRSRAPGGAPGADRGGQEQLRAPAATGRTSSWRASSRRRSDGEDSPEIGDWKWTN